MKKEAYYITIIVLIIFSILGIYNFSHPIKDLQETNIIYQGKVLGITEEYDYNENSEYVKKFYVELLVNDTDEHISIETAEDKVQNYKPGDKINFYEEKGEYLITNSRKTPTNGGIIWLVLSLIELIIAIKIFIKCLKSK